MYASLRLVRPLVALAMLVAPGLWGAASATAQGTTVEGSTARQDRLVLVNQAAWAADLDPTRGSADDAIAVFTPRACPAGTTRHKTSVVDVRPERSADRAAAAAWLDWPNLYSPVPAALPGPLVAYPAAMSWSQLARIHGLRIVAGTYEIETRCQDNLGQRVFARWRGRVVFDTPTRFHVPSDFSTDLGRAAMEQRAAQAPGAGPAAPAPAPSQGDGVPATASPSASASASEDVASEQGRDPGTPSPSSEEGSRVSALEQAGSDGRTGATSAPASPTLVATLVVAVLTAALAIAAGVALAARRGRDR